MPEPLPLTDLLALLRERGLQIGVREHLTVGRLLARWDDPEIGSLRSALSALLARNLDEVLEVRRAFDELYGEPAKAPPPPPPRAEKRGAWRWAVAAGILLAVTVVAGVRMWPHEPPEPQPIQSQSPAQEAGEKPPPAPEIADTFRVPDRWRAATGAAGLAGGVLLGLWWLRLRRAAGQAARRRWREQVEEMIGPQGYEITLGETPLPLPAPVLDDAAALLGRRTPTAPRWGELDVDCTLERTLRGGLAPDPVFRVRAAAPPLLVLEDIGSEMLPWEGRIASLLAALAARGVAIDHWRFHADAGSLFRAPGDPEISLQQLARASGDRALLVISAGEGVLQEREGRTAPWVDRLAAWPRLAWLHPVSDPGLWRPALRKVTIAAWPLTSDGLLTAARHLGHGRTGPAARGTARALADRPVTPADVDRLRSLLTMAPRHDPDLLELLRLRFCPHVPAAALLEALEAPPLMSPLRLGPDPAEVHAFMADLLAGSEPETGSPAHARWRLDMALQEIRVPSRAERAASELSDLARGPLAHLVEDSVAELKAPGAEWPLPTPLARDLHRNVLAPVRRRASNGPLGPWSAAPGPGWRALSATSVLLAVFFLLHGFSPVFTKEEELTLEHRYQLSVSGDDQPASGSGVQVKVSGDPKWNDRPKILVGPEKMEINQLPWSTVLPDRDRGNWVYVRDLHPDKSGVLGISDSLWIADPEPARPTTTSVAPTTTPQPSPPAAQTTEAGAPGGYACPSEFSYPAYNPRSCDASCDPLDLLCRASKLDCEKLKEQERLAYEASKAVAQKAFSVEKDACEARKALRSQEQPTRARSSDPVTIDWPCRLEKVGEVTYELGPYDDYVSSSVRILKMSSDRLVHKERTSYDEGTRRVTGTVRFRPPAIQAASIVRRVGDPGRNDCHALIRLDVVVRPSPPAAH